MNVLILTANMAQNFDHIDNFNFGHINSPIQIKFLGFKTTPGNFGQTPLKEKCECDGGFTPLSIIFMTKIFSLKRIVEPIYCESQQNEPIAKRCGISPSIFRLTTANTNRGNKQVTRFNDRKFYFLGLSST